jgi:hypothetical protein
MTAGIPVISFRQGDHICLFYRDDQEQMKVAAPFVEIGLLSGERCLCVLTSVQMEILRESLASKGMNPDREVSRGALLLATPQEAYLRNGRFNRREMVKFLDDAMREAISIGFTGFRGTGDLTWSAGDWETCEQMPEYEAARGRYFPGKPSLGICMYDLNSFSAARVQALLRAHRLAIVHRDGNNKVVRVRKNGVFGDVLFDREEPTSLFHFVVQKDDCPEVLMSGQDSTLSGAMRLVEMSLANWA